MKNKKQILNSIVLLFLLAGLIIPVTALENFNPLPNSEKPFNLKEKEGNIAVFQNETFIGVFTLSLSSKNSEFLARPEFTLQPIKNR